MGSAINVTSAENKPPVAGEHTQFCAYMLNNVNSKNRVLLIDHILIRRGQEREQLILHTHR